MASLLFDKRRALVQEATQVAQEKAMTADRQVGLPLKIEKATDSQYNYRLVIVRARPE